MKDVLDLLARVCLAFIFLYEAYDSIFYFQATKAKMEAYGLTWNSNFLLVAAIVILILGGTLLLIGYRTSFGVFLLMLYWIPLTLVIHSFWNDPEPEKRLQAILFMKNIAILGGLLMVYVNDSGRYSIKRLFATTKVPGT
ncbi:MAG: DoxX family protein [Bacteroidota bacterium]